MADQYAAVYYNNYSIIISNNTDDFLCYCTYSDTFGKYCEYQLTHEANSFELSQKAQSSIRYAYQYHHQYFGDIVCYKTLSCNSGLLCLDWRDICDREQQCENGQDEENCDKLEFNECEDDEFRCNNGMCISEEYWLDGDKDCMDWSDENFPEFFGKWCFQETTTMDCDEHLCIYQMWSCGDGQCIIWKDRLAFQNLVAPGLGCTNQRHMNHMCELSALRRAWTLPNGLCWTFGSRYNDSQLSMDNNALTNDAKCFYLLRCTLSDGLELHCPCNRLNCSRLMPNVCRASGTYIYPQGQLIRPYVLMLYSASVSFEDQMPHAFILLGNARCRGYHASIKSPERFPLFKILLESSHWDTLLCLLSTTIKTYNSSMKYDSNCWKDSLTFNGRPYAVQDVCKISQECLSQYRINDGISDCVSNEDDDDAVINENFCTRIRKHRFQCSTEEPTCLPTSALTAEASLCSNKYDTYLYGYDRSVKEMICQKSNLENCRIFKEYIKNSSLISNSSTNSYLLTNQPQYQIGGRISFRLYCDGAWNSQGHIDELSQNCQNWICHRNQYQCQTGQCIPFEWVCDKEWDCTDASDEEALPAIQQWSPHNQQLKGLNETRRICSEIYSNLPFSEFCNRTSEFPCLRSNVSDPLNVTQYRPCIPYSKIGDEIEDCYNAYDEKNALVRRDGQMWGFTLRCNETVLPYLSACHDPSFACAQILCFNRRYPTSACSEPTDTVCITDGHCVPKGRCNQKRDCLYGEDEYWCASNDYSEQFRYRYKKLKQKDTHQIFDRQTYPSFEFSIETFRLAPQSMLSNLKRMKRNLHNSDVKYSFWCNKGVSVIMFNQTVCYCPPAYFGDKCQFFSDRITIITHLDLNTWSSIPTTNVTLFKIKVNFLFNKIVIDHYEFYSDPAMEIRSPLKHKFYFLYSRSNQMLAHKKTRFFNRTDIENNHFYSVHFDIYALYNNRSKPVPLGSWHYPIYFDFLPAFRLATVLRFAHWFANSSLNQCTNHTCNQNSTCQPIFNQNNSYFCSCRSGFYGENCSRYEQACDSYCSPHSFCRPNDHSLISNTNHPFCICPLEHFGPRCFLRFEQCDSNPCINNGLCVYTNESYSGDAFQCICSKFFYGDRCQHPKFAIQVQLNTSTIIESPRASTIQYYDVYHDTLELVLRHQQVSQGLPSSIFYPHGRSSAPVLSVLKAHYDSIEPQYFIIYIKPNSSVINITSTPKHCPLASSLLNKNDLSKVPALFKYHHICRNDSQRLCFYDDDYLCICQWDNYRVDCFVHNTQIDHCDKCLSNGKCVKGDTDDDNNFICLCRRCQQGRLCEFSIEAFGFTLDSILIGFSKGVKIVYFSLVLLLFIVGFFNNLCSFVTFKRPVPRKFGVGNYLFIITCLNQLSVLSLLGKFIQLTFELTNFNSCKIISYLLSVFTRSTYWLTSWVTIDRLLIIFFPTSIALRKPRLAITITIITILCLFGMHTHEIIYYTIIQQLSTGSSICVTNFNTQSIFYYNRVSTLIHYLLPFLIQIIGVTLLIILAARSRTKTAGGKLPFQQMLIKQFRTQKELYITPIIIVLSALPQTILTFSLACIELNAWHRHTLLIAYLFSYVPQALGFILYVLPSTTYKKEFSETLFARQYLSWLTSTKSSAITVSKKK